MTNPTKPRKIILIQDKNGDGILPISKKLLRRLGWQIGDSLQIEVLNDQTIVITKMIRPDPDYEEILTAAIKAFGDSHMAHHWLSHKNLCLGMSPIEYMNNANGKDEILKLLNAIAYGGVV